LASDCTTLGGFSQCLHPWSYVFVQHDGGVGFCDHLIANDASIFGNLLDNRFMDIWNGDLYRSLRDDHREHRFDALTASGIECAWCYESRYVDHEDLIEPDLQPMRLTTAALIRELLPDAPFRKVAEGQPVTLRPHRPQT
jgi:MoaA/NifB/PqqE/SkfB family radical SAM enzyme